MMSAEASCLVSFQPLRSSRETREDRYPSRRRNDRRDTAGLYLEDTGGAQKRQNNGYAGIK